jgi:DNA topoisomerase-1
VACSGYPGCTYTLNIPDPEEDVVDVSEIENTTCEECGSPMKLRQSRTGSTFLGCTAYPKCRNVVNVAVAGGKAEARPDEPTGEKCPRCGHELVRRHGRYGAYVSCSNYPACKFKPPKPIKDTGVRCPKDGGIIAERRGRFRPFYGCVNYPNCDFSLSVRPIPEACPQCGNPYLLYRERKSGNVFACDKAGCGFEKAPGVIPEIVEIIPEVPLEPEPAPKSKAKAKAPAGTKTAKVAKAAKTAAPKSPRRRAAKA